MSNLISVADAIKREAKRHEAFVEAAKVLERIGSLEQAEEDAKRRHAVATADAVAAREELRLVEEGLAKAKTGIQEARTRAAEDAAVVKANADGEAKRIVQIAEAQAKEITKKALTEAERVVQHAHAQETVMRECEEKVKKELADVTGEIAARSEELSAVETKLMAAKQRVAELLR